MRGEGRGGRGSNPVGGPLALGGQVPVDVDHGVRHWKIQSEGGDSKDFQIKVYSYIDSLHDCGQCFQSF